MTKINKPLKDWDISEFTDMGSLPKLPVDPNRRPFFGFCKVKKEGQKPQSKGYVIRINPSVQ